MNELINQIEKASRFLGDTQFWCLEEVAMIIGLDTAELENAKFDARQACAYNGINHEEHFCIMNNFTLMTRYGLCRFIKSLQVNKEGLSMARDFYEMDEPTDKFTHVYDKANDYFLFPGDKVRILHEIDCSQGLTGTIGTVILHKSGTLSIMGPFHFFCNRTDVELVERYKK